LSSEIHHCPICGAELPVASRYPDYLCEGCVAKATDEQGRSLAFSNVSPTGGFEAVIRSTGEPRDSHICYVEGWRCWADEARFGGIVVEPVRD
jgi:hypothetical protein